MTVRLAVCALIGYPSRGKATQDDKALNGAGLDEYDLEKMYVYMCVCVCVCVCGGGGEASFTVLYRHLPGMNEKIYKYN